jgi:hypothetical protein
MSEFYTHDARTRTAKAASVALAVMNRQGVNRWEDVDTSQLSEALVDRLARYKMILSVLRNPIKIPKTRGMTPCISIAICAKCGGWYTIQLKKNNRLSGRLLLSEKEVEKLKCITTTGCTGTVEVAFPANVEGPVETTSNSSMGAK